MLDLLKLLGDLASVADLTVVASDEFVPPDDWRSQVALPLGILFLLGGPFMLLRANLGTRRAYLLEATCLFGFVFLFGCFWAWGAPGTPQYLGPTALPGQPPDFLEPEWVPFAQDSVIAQDPRYDVVQDYPEGWQPVPADLEDEVEEVADEITGFFSSEVAGEAVAEDWVLDEESFTPAYAVGEDGRPIIGVQVSAVDPETAEPAPEDGSFIAFALFDEGNPLLPSLIVIGISFVGFVGHFLLLGWDERQERRDREEDLAEPEPADTDDRVPTPA